MSKRILIVNQRFWPAATGSERWLLAIAQRLVAAGHAVTVATTDGLTGDFASNPAASRVTTADPAPGGVDVRRFPLEHLPGSPWTYALVRYRLLPLLAALPTPAPWLIDIARWTPRSSALLAWLATSTEPFDLVIGANILAEGLAYAAADAARRRQARFAFVPFTHLGAGRAPGSDDVGRQYTMRQQRALVRQADRVLTMTQAERDFYVRAGAPADGVHVVGAGIDAEALQPGDASRFRVASGISGPIAAFVAPLHVDKGLFQVIDAVERCWWMGRPVTLVTVGSAFGSGRQRLSVLSAKRPGSVCSVNDISEADKRDLLAAADVLVLPSRTNSFGIVFLEAWAQGKPVIGSTAWGMRDVITPDENGLLVRFNDLGATERALIRLLDEPDLRARLGANGRRAVVERHTWDHVYARVQAALAEDLG